ncbi:MAG: fibronectin type III domain-containing protein, partial [Deltaproteobacteria bacterium]|nr:fibronectin type III domain-containing protein [Deltaproteobacteria bacterium]
IEYSEQDPPISPVVITTSNVSNIRTTSVKAGGDVTDSGGGTVSERGIVWDESENPDVNDNKVEDESSGTGSYTVQITGLSPGTTYHVRAYAVNEDGTAYGDDIQFTTTREVTGIFINMTGLFGNKIVVYK